MCGVVYGYEDGVIDKHTPPLHYPICVTKLRTLLVTDATLRTGASAIFVRSCCVVWVGLKGRGGQGGVGCVKARAIHMDYLLRITMYILAMQWVVISSDDEEIRKRKGKEKDKKWLKLLLWEGH